MLKQELKKFVKLQNKYADLLEEYQNHILNLLDEEKLKYNFYLREKDRLDNRRKDAPDLASLFMSEDEKNLINNPPDKFVLLYNERKDIKLQLAKIKTNFVKNLIPEIVINIKNGKLKCFPFEVQTYCEMDYDSSNFGGLARAKLKFLSKEFGNLEFDYDIENRKDELEEILTLTNLLQPYEPKIKKFASAAADYDSRFEF